MNIQVLPDVEGVARAAAAFTATEAHAQSPRGRFVMAVSGGHTPWSMLRALADESLPWPGVHVVQVDERVAPAGHPDRNLTHLRERFLAHCPLRPDQLHAMPVESSELTSASSRYAAVLPRRTRMPVAIATDHGAYQLKDGAGRATVRGPAPNRC